MDASVSVSTSQRAQGAGRSDGVWVPSADVITQQVASGFGNRPAVTGFVSSRQAAGGVASSVPGTAVRAETAQQARGTAVTARVCSVSVKSAQAATAAVQQRAGGTFYSRQRVSGQITVLPRVAAAVLNTQRVSGSAAARQAITAQINSQQIVTAAAGAVRVAAAYVAHRQSVVGAGGRARAARRCLVFHPHRGGFTHYADYGFDAFFDHGGVKYGVRGSDVFRLTGTQGLVAARATTTKIGGAGLVNIGFGYVTGVVPEEAVLTALAEAGNSQAAQYQRTDGGQTHRGQFARGLRGIYWQVQVDIASAQRWSVQDIQPLRSSANRRVGA